MTDNKGRLDLVITLLTDLQNETRAERKAVERRLDSLERWRSFLAGAMALLSSGTPFIVWMMGRG